MGSLFQGCKELETHFILQIAGSEVDNTFTNLTLHEGSHYVITVVACNQAGLCTEAKSAELLVSLFYKSQFKPLRIYFILKVKRKKKKTLEMNGLYVNVYNVLYPFL